MLRVICDELIQLSQQFLVQFAEAAQRLLLPQVLDHHQDLLALRVRIHLLLGLVLKRWLVFVQTRDGPVVVRRTPDRPWRSLLLRTSFLCLLFLQLQLGLWRLVNQRHHIVIDNVPVLDLNIVSRVVLWQW